LFSLPAGDTSQRTHLLTTLIMVTVKDDPIHMDEFLMY